MPVQAPRFSVKQEREELLQRFHEKLIPSALGGGWATSPLSGKEQQLLFDDVLTKVFPLQNLNKLKAGARAAFFAGEKWVNGTGYAFNMPALAHRYDGKSGKLEMVALIEARDSERHRMYIGYDDLLTHLPGSGCSVLWSLNSFHATHTRQIEPDPFDQWGLKNPKPYRTAPQLTTLSFHQSFVEPFLKWNCGVAVPHLEMGPPKTKEGEVLSMRLAGERIDSQRIRRREETLDRVTIEVPAGNSSFEVAFNHLPSGMLTCRWRILEEAERTV